MLVVIRTEKLLFVRQFYLVMSGCACISKRSVFTAQVALANKQNPKPCQPKACCLLICSQLRSLLWRVCIEDSTVSLKVWTADQRNDKQIWKPIGSLNEQKFCISNQKTSYHLMSDTPWIHTNRSNKVLALRQAKMSADERTWNSVPTLLPTANQGSNSTWEQILQRTTGKAVHSHAQDEMRCPSLYTKITLKNIRNWNTTSLASYCDSSEFAFFKSPFHLVF